MTAALAFEYVYALAVPVCLAVMCTSALLSRHRFSHWLVPLLLLSVMLTVAIRPHVLRVTVVGIAAGAVAIVACLVGCRRSAVAGTLLCCAAISVS